MNEDEYLPVFWFEKKKGPANTNLQLQKERDGGNLQIQKKMKIQNSLDLPRAHNRKPRGYKSLHASEFIILSNACEK